MAKRDDGLLAQIEREVLDESRPVASALRKCLTLGGRAQSADLREWAARELHGYRGAEGSLPAYRRITAQLMMDGFEPGAIFRGRQVSVIDLPEEARDVIGDEVTLTAGAGEIEAWVQRAEARGGSLELGPPAAAELAWMMTNEVGRYRVERVYWSVSVAVLRGVVDAVRTVLTELVAEMRAGTPGGDEVPPAEVAAQAVQFAVYGKGHRITVATAGEGGTTIAAPQDGDLEEPGFWTTSRRIWAVLVGLATIIGAIAAVVALHPKL
jgi:AbiTii